MENTWQHLNSRSQLKVGQEVLLSQNGTNGVIYLVSGMGESAITIVSFYNEQGKQLQPDDQEDLVILYEDLGRSNLYFKPEVTN